MCNFPFCTIIVDVFVKTSGQVWDTETTLCIRTIKMLLNLLPNEASNLFVVQKSQIGYNYIEHAFKYVLIPISEDLKCVCQLIPKSDLPVDHCVLDLSVIHFANLHALYNVFCKSIKYFSTVTSGVKVLDPIVDAKSLEVSVIFRNSTDVLKWKPNPKLTSVVRDILTLYTVVNNSYVTLPNKKVNCNDIVGICVHNTGNKKSASRINSSTSIVPKQLMSKKKFAELYLNEHPCKVAGLSNQFNLLNSIYNAHLYQKSALSVANKTKLSQKILIIGPSGCGKTSLVKYFAQTKKCGLIIVEGSQISNATPGESEIKLRKLFDEARKRSQEDANDICIVLLDQVDNICRKSGSAGLHLKRISQQLFQILEDVDSNTGLIVIATTNNVHLLDPSIRRSDRLEVELYIGTPTEKERREILQLYCTSYGMKLSICKKVAACTPGYVGADLSLLVQDVQRAHIKNPDIYNHENGLMELFRKCIAKQRPSSLRSGLGVIRSENVQMSNLGGLAMVKASLAAFIEWPLKYPNVFRKLGLPMPKGVLLYGPPGCAKTSLACAIAHSLNVNFLSVSAAELYSSYVGEAERNVIELFHKARVNSPCIIFIDEIDALVGNRNTSSKHVQEKILSTFLVEMDGVGNKVDTFAMYKLKDDKRIDKTYNTVQVIAATNRPDKLDSALLRPGRFDKLLQVSPPDSYDRLDILQTVTRQWKMSLSSCVDLLHIARNTENFSGADLTNLLKEAGCMALFHEGMATTQIKQEHILEALNFVKPSLNEEKIHLYELK